MASRIEMLNTIFHANTAQVAVKKEETSSYSSIHCYFI